MKDRVRQVMDHFGLTQLQFANKLAVSQATISSIYKGRTAPTNNLVQAIHQAFPAVSVSWLMFGEGDMLLSLSGDDQSQNTSEGIGQNVGMMPSATPSLFDAPAAPTFTSKAAKTSQNPVPSAEMQLAEAISHLKNANIVDKPKRKIKEIRVFFDDGTYESFVPNSKQ